MHLKTTSHHRREHALHISKTMSHAGCICNNNLRLFSHCSSWVEILCLLLFVHWNLKSINNFFQKKPRFFPPWVKQPWVKDFKIESAAFPDENQPKISSAKNQPEKNSASRISAEKMCQLEFGHKKVRLWGLKYSVSLAVNRWRHWFHTFLGHLLRDNLISSVKMSVRLYVHTYVYVHTSTIKLNAAANQIMVFVKVDETFTMIWLSRSSEVRFTVTWDLKFQKWWFSKSISSAIFQPIKKFPTVSDTRPKYLKSLGLDFWIPASYRVTWLQSLPKKSTSSDINETWNDVRGRWNIHDYMTFNVVRDRGQGEEMTSVPYWDYFYWVSQKLTEIKCWIIWSLKYFCKWNIVK